MKSTSVVGERGQVTIPKKLRDSLGLSTGMRLEFKERNGTLIARRQDDGYAARLQSLVGFLPTFGVDAYLRETRGRDGAHWFTPVRPKRARAGSSR
ncbi:MAG: AbrB/MazE/SpoVT family DNA-binding domain-containing protein [Terriglobales bacterium]